MDCSRAHRMDVYSRLANQRAIRYVDMGKESVC